MQKKKRIHFYQNQLSLISEFFFFYWTTYQLSVKTQMAPLQNVTFLYEGLQV